MAKSANTSKLLFLNYAWRDLKRQKIRTIFAVSGVMISILLLTIIGSLADSLSYSYLDQATAQVGSSDIIFSRVIQADFNFDMYFEEDLIENNLRGEIDEIEEFFPRLLSLIRAEYYDQNTDRFLERQVLFYGINSTREQNNGNMGDLFISEYKINERGDYVWEKTDTIYNGPIPEGRCIVTNGFARLFNITSAGQTINLTSSSKTETYIVDAIVEQHLRFSSIENTLVILELPEAQDLLNRPKMVNYVMTTLKNREYIYDTRDVGGTVRNLRLVGEQIQDIVGFEFMITLPKMSQLQALEEQSLQMNMMFGFLTFFSMIITGILINSILTTSLEERIREFGVLRTLGGKKKFCFQLVLASGAFIATIGTSIGVALGAFLAPSFLSWYFEFFNIWTMRIQFIILPSTIFQSIIIGIGVTTLISMIPAFKAGKTQLTKAIDPSKSNQEEKYEIRKEDSPNLKLMFFGVGFGFIGIIIFIIFPAIVSTGSQQMTTGLLIFLLFVVLVGLVLTTIGIVPFIQNIIGKLMKPFIRRYYPLYKLSLVRYRRRNLGTTVMFAMTFAFIFFVSTMIQIQEANSRALIEFQHGSDLVISNTGTINQNNAINYEFFDELEKIPGIRSASPTFHNSFDVSLAAGLLLDITEEGIDFNNLNFGSLFGTINKNEVLIGDIGDYKEYFCNVIGIDETYTDSVRTDLLMWDENSGSSTDSIDQLFETQNSVIIAKVFADALNIRELGQKIRLTVYDPNNPDTMYNVTTHTVVGISRGMPGFYNMRSAQINLWVGSGVLMSSDNYAELMNWGKPNVPETIIDKIFINLINNDYDTLKQVESIIEDKFSEDYSFEANEILSLLGFMQNQNDTTGTIMETVLFFSIIVSLFGLLSSMYSTLLERMFEVGILRAMGLKPYEVRNLLISESLTIMLSSGGCGMGIGVFVAYLLQSNIAIITEMPVIVALNYATLASTFLVSIAISILGMIFITRKVRKWNVVDIIRSTFS